MAKTQEVTPVTTVKRITWIFIYIIILLTHLVSALIAVPALHLFMLVNWNRSVFY